MKGKRHTTDQIFAKLRETDAYAGFASLFEVSHDDGHSEVDLADFAFFQTDWAEPSNKP